MNKRCGVHCGIHFGSMKENTIVQDSSNNSIQQLENVVNSSISSNVTVNTCLENLEDILKSAPVSEQQIKALKSFLEIKNSIEQKSPNTKSKIGAFLETHGAWIVNLPPAIYAIAQLLERLS